MDSNDVPENPETLNGSDDEVDVLEVDTTEVKSKKVVKRKRRSKVWSFFEMLPLGADKIQRCKCKQCGTIYVAESKFGTGNMLKHMNVCVRRDTRDVGQLLLSQSSGVITMHSSKFDPAKFRDLISSAIIMHDLPFQFVEYEGIRAAFRYLNESYQPVSRNTAKADILKMYKNEKGRIRHLLGSLPGRICLTSDMWSSLTTDGYLCLTAHFIDEHWNLQKRVINFSYMPSPHNGLTITEKIYSLLNDWGIEKKLFSITLDNASSNLAFVEMLKAQLNLSGALLSGGSFFHIRCCAHILNLIVQDGLKEIDESILKIRESVKYVKGSPARKQKFLECISHVSLDAKKGLRQDVPTRWNATFLMLETAIYFRRAFSHLALSDSNYKCCPTYEEWTKAEKICNFLEEFYTATKIFSGTKYPTANLYFPLVFLVQRKLVTEMKSKDGFMSKMAGQMYSKFEKYWSDFSVILAFAVILDPRYKFGFVAFCYNKIHGSGSNEGEEVREKLFCLFDEYLFDSPMPSITSTFSQEVGTGSRDMVDTQFSKESRDVMQEFDMFQSGGLLASAQKTELELYLDEPNIDRKVDLDILSFWKGNQFRYPILSRMARDILSIPVSTVASESAFSVGGRVLDQYRTSLLPENVEALVCTRDWLFNLKESSELELDKLIVELVNVNINKEDLTSTECSNVIVD